MYSLSNPQITLARRAPRASLVSLLGVLVLASSGDLIAEPYRPTTDSEILERLPGGVSNHEMRRLRELRAELSHRPRDLDLAVRTARHLIERARAEGDPRYNGYAEAALKPWWNSAEPPSEVLLLRATLRQSSHRFDEALDDLGRLLSLRPRNVQAWLTRATILQVRGELDAALESCLALSRFAEPLVAIACTTGVRSLGGDAARSHDFLEQALEARTDVDPNLRVWVVTGLAEMATRLGHARQAEDHFRQALDIAPPGPYLLAAYADFLLDHDRPREVVRLLEGKERVDTLLLRLAQAEQHLGSANFAEHARALEARFRAAQSRGDTTHQGDEARFRHHLQNRYDEALRLALENWRVQREPRDARLVLESALATRDPAAAEPVLAWMRKTGLEDVRLALLADELGRMTSPSPAGQEVSP